MKKHEICSGHRGVAGLVALQDLVKSGLYHKVGPDLSQNGDH